MKIRLLPEDVYTLIAAGEVIDRPASVVRELLQNSIDAHSDRIVLSLENGGKTFISVIDDGSGMDEGDVKLAGMKHSTSKIATASDLSKVLTYGFRGEALSSISAVSEMEIESCAKDEPNGHSVRITFGGERSFQLSPITKGTSITVKNLFFNMPGRMRFMKSDNVEYNYCEKEFLNAASANPEISFKLISDGRVVHNFKSAAFEKRIEEIKGFEFISNSVIVNYFDRNARIYGFVGKPSIYDSRKYNFNTIFVNKRFVVYPQIKRALYSPFGSQLAKHFAPYIIFLELDPSEVDVNIHPAKKEVRFFREDRIFSSVTAAVRESLKFHRLEPSFEKSKDPVAEAMNTPESFVRESSLFSDIDYILSKKSSETKMQEYSRFWQVNDSYILVNLKDKLYFIDQHAAHERIVFENVMKERERVSSQQLLFPFIVRLNTELYEFYESNKTMFERWGFITRNFDRMKILVEAIPSVINEAFDQDDFIKTVEELMATGSSRKDEEVSKIIACRAAIKAGKKMKVNEMEDLFNQLFLCENPYSCPHGRPTFIVFDKDEMGKWFRR